MDIAAVENFLAPNECLVYVENRQSFADVDGSTQIAQIQRSYIDANVLWFDLLLLTDGDGDRLPDPIPITISGDSIVSNRAVHDIHPLTFYHFAPLTFSERIQYPITATVFVLKKNLEKPLESTSRSALGSGIYGRYIQNPSDIPSLQTDSQQAVYPIECPHAYPIQDKEHGESITIASLNTNRYLDRIIQSLRGADITLETVSTRIQQNESPTLLTLWNIVFYRTQERITQEWLNDILASYAVQYLIDTSLQDTNNGDIIQELPINTIMRARGYDGLIAMDVYNNGWDRGCVSYNYTNAKVLQGDMARY